MRRAPSSTNASRVELKCLLLGLFRSDYPQHAAYLLMDGLIVVRLQQPDGYAALLTSASIHNFRLYLGSL
jgi:hypothetical protein